MSYNYEIDIYDESEIPIISAQIQSALNERVSPIIEEIFAEMVSQNIYDTYIPKEGGWVGGETYDRRYSLLSGFETTVSGDFTISTKSTAQPNKSPLGTKFNNDGDSAFLAMLASGNTGLWRGGFARPVIPDVQAIIEDNQTVRSAVEAAISSVTTEWQRG